MEVNMSEKRMTMLHKLEGTDVLRNDRFFNEEKVDAILEFQDAVVDVVMKEVVGVNYKISDVSKLIKEMACELGVVEAEKVQEFLKDSNKLQNLIACLCSGKRAEKHVYRQVYTTPIPKLIMNNIELYHDEVGEGEIDLIAITERGVYLLEVKQNCQNMILTESGNYMTEKGKIISNLPERMNVKEFLLRQALTSWSENTGKKIKIETMVLLANTDMKLEDEYDGLLYCYPAQFVAHLRNSTNEAIYSCEDMEQMAEAIERSQMKKSYPIDYDFKKYAEELVDVVMFLDKVKMESEKKEKTECGSGIFEEEVIMGLRESLAKIREYQRERELQNKKKEQREMAKGLGGTLFLAVAATFIGSLFVDKKKR